MVDAEVIVMLIHFLKRVGLEKLELQINSLGCQALSAQISGRAQRVFNEEIISTLRRLSKEASDTILCASLTARSRPVRRPLRNAPKVTDFICPECQRHFNQRKKISEMGELPYILNPRMVRGLDYYTRTAFEVVSYQLGSQNAVTGGGPLPTISFRRLEVLMFRDRFCDWDGEACFLATQR